MDGPPLKKQKGDTPPLSASYDTADVAWSLLNELPEELGGNLDTIVAGNNKKADDTILRHRNLSQLLSSTNDIHHAPMDGMGNFPSSHPSSMGAHQMMRYPMSQQQQLQQQQQQQFMMQQGHHPHSRRMFSNMGQPYGFHGNNFAGGTVQYSRFQSPLPNNYLMRQPELARHRFMSAGGPGYYNDIRTAGLNGGMMPRCLPPADAGMIDDQMMAKVVNESRNQQELSKRFAPVANGMTSTFHPTVNANESALTSTSNLPTSRSNIQPTSKIIPEFSSPDMNSFHSPTSVPSDGELDMPVTSNVERRREAQQKLALLLHAHKCQRRDQMNGISQICNIPGCVGMITLLKHMTECQDGRGCQVQDCSLLRQIISHWKNCNRSDCILCAPLKNRRPNMTVSSASNPPSSDSLQNSRVISPKVATSLQDSSDRKSAKESVVASASDSQDAVKVACSNGVSIASLDLDSVPTSGDGVITDTLTCPSKSWHQTVALNLRNHLVHKLVEAIFPTPDPSLLKHDRMIDLVQYARKVEGDMFDSANSLEEYYHLLAEKIYKIQRELEEKKMKRLLEVNSTPPLSLPGSYLNGPADSQTDPSFPATQQSVNSGNNPPPRPFMESRFQSDPSLGNASHMSTAQGSRANLLTNQQHRPCVDPRMGFPRAPSFVSGSVAPYSSPDPANQQGVCRPNRTEVGMPNIQTNVDESKTPDVSVSRSSVSDVAYSLHESVPVTSSTANLPLQSRPDLPSVSSGLPVSNSQSSNDMLTPTTFPASHLAETDSNSPTNVVHSAASACSAMNSGNASPVVSNNFNSEHGKSFENSIVSPQMPPHEDVTDDEAAVKSEPRSLEDFKYEPSSNAHEAISDDEEPPKSAKSELHVKTEEVKEENDVPEDVKKEEMPADVTVKVEEPEKEGNEMETGEVDGGPNVSANVGDNKEVEGTVRLKVEGKKTWSKEELSEALMPTLDRLFCLEPEAAPFRIPVDPIALGIPDYYDVVKNPMDLSTIRQKLEAGQYSEPWQYIDDINLMFDNAWQYNRKTSRVYKFCSKLAEVFESEIDRVMQSLGFCCGRRYVFSPQVLCCFGKQLCTIPRDSIYYSFQDRYIYCEKCFNELQGEDIEMADDPSQPGLKIKKEEFIKDRNDRLDYESFVNCKDCDRKMHRICVLHMEQVWPEGYVCDACLKSKGGKRKDNKYSAKRLPSTKLATYLENRVNLLLKRKDAGTGDVTIRVLSTYDKAVEVKPGMKSRFVNEGEMPESYPYRVKAMFAFEEIDGVDVCFFGMHVQEYGSDCHPNNARRVYIAYLDSVHFFQPKQLRTTVYHEILIGYMDYAKSLGFQTAHIWACPPSEGDDYIFHCHPAEQKIPKPKRLQEWYKKMLDKALLDHVIYDYKDILKDTMDNNLISVTQIPYFEGDFWPNILEECIKEQEQEELEKRRRKEEEEAADNDDLEPAGEHSVELQMVAGKKKGQKSGNTKKKNTKHKKPANRKNKSGLPHGGNDLAAKVLSTMDKHKEGFFVIRLQANDIDTPIVDPDPQINCDLMDGRDAFLTLSRDKHYEFSSLRRAKFSSMGLLYELHHQGRDGFVYTCNDCKANVETRYHCGICDDFDLCISCYQRSDHVHKSKMSRLGLDLDDGSSNESRPATQNTQEARRISIQSYIQSLVHACHCRDANCRLPICQRMKRIVKHAQSHKPANLGSCAICRQLLTLCVNHAKVCKETKCPVPHCQSLKQKLEQQRAEQLFKQQQLMRRRMALMQRVPEYEQPTPSSTANCATSSPPTSLHHQGFGNGGGKSTYSVLSPASPGVQMASYHPDLMAQRQSTGPVGYLPPGPMVQQRHFLGSMNQWSSQFGHGSIGLNPMSPGEIMYRQSLMQGGMHGSMQGGMQGSMQGGMQGSMQGGMQGSMQGGMPGSMQGSMQGGMQGSMQGGMQGSMQGGMQGSMQGGMPGNMQGSMQGGMPGNMQGSMQGGMHGSLHGSMQGGMQSSMQGGMQGNMQGVMQAGNVQMMQNRASNIMDAVGLQQQQQQPQQMTSGTASNSSMQLLISKLKSPASQQQQEEVLNILKTNPRIMSTFIKQTSQNQRQQQQMSTGSVPGGVGEGSMEDMNVDYNMMSVMHGQMMDQSDPSMVPSQQWMQQQNMARGGRMFQPEQHRFPYSMYGGGAVSQPMLERMPTNFIGNGHHPMYQSTNGRAMVAPYGTPMPSQLQQQLQQQQQSQLHLRSPMTGRPSRFPVAPQGLGMLPQQQRALAPSAVDVMQSSPLSGSLPSTASMMLASQSNIRTRNPTKRDASIRRPPPQYGEVMSPMLPGNALQRAGADGMLSADQLGTNDANLFSPDQTLARFAQSEQNYSLDNLQYPGNSQVQLTRFVNNLP